MTGLKQLLAPRDGPALVPGTGARVLLLSMRRLDDLVAYSMIYEFEDVAAEVTGADRVDAGGGELLEWCRRAYKLLRYGSRSRALARTLAPRGRTVRLEREYDLFFPTFNHAYELYALSQVPDWRARCRLAACFVSELWLEAMPRYLLELLSAFDHVFLGVQTPVNEVARITGRPCSFLPLGADVLRFSPLLGPAHEKRPIDVCNIGRRSPVTHEALLKLARDGRIFYYYDTVSASGIDGKQRTFHVQNAAEHRLLLASILRRSRFYFTHRARINEPELTRGHDEISGRFYEGVAAGTVMLGEPPADAVFQQLFDWPDAVLRAPFDCPGIGERLAELERDPQRLARISFTNAQQAALRHDWVYRLRAVYQTLGLPPTSAMLAREARLRALAMPPLGLSGGKAA